MIPVYAPIPSIRFDQARMLNDIRGLALPHAVERSVIFNQGKSVYDNSVNLNISSESALKNTTHYVQKSSGELETVRGDYSTYLVLNLTRIQSDPNTEWLTYLERNSAKINFWHFYLQPWEWLPSLKGSYLQTFIDSLPFEYVQTVRLVSMRPPAIGQVHVDANKKANRAWLNKGFASLTLNVTNGGSYMRFSAGDKIFEADPDMPASHFDDAYHHGVPELKSERHQLRIFGKMSNEKYLSLMDLSKAVWDETIGSENLANANV